MEAKIKLIVLVNNLKLISQIDEVGGDIGEPDCKLTEPFLILENEQLVPWLIDYTSQNVYMIHSDKILTLANPKQTLIEKYENLIK